MKNQTPRTPSDVQPENSVMSDHQMPRRSNWLQGLHVASVASALEQRIMLDAAGAQAMDAVADDDAANDDVIVHADNDSTAPDRHEIVIVDSSIANYEALLLDIEGADDPALWTTDPDTGIARLETIDDNRQITVYAINGNDHGFDTVNAVLANESGVDTLHILSHGETASILFGQDRIDLNTLQQNPDQISHWAGALNANADILLYGCHTAGSDAGEAFVSAFADATAADVAASDDATGNAAHQGDYDLEFHAGSIESEMVTEDLAQAAFEGTLAATPEASVTIPSENFINEPFNFTIDFSNDGNETGYEPFVNLFAAPGVDINGASFLGSSLPTGDLYTWDTASSSWLDAASNPLTENPLNPALPLPADPGIDDMQWYIIDLPFGSFVPDQPIATVQVSATLSAANGAIVGTPLAINAQAGFEYGKDAFNNPSTDAPLLGLTDSKTITPTVLELTKIATNEDTNAVGSEREQATGPNNPITYQITVDIADGETVDSVVISDTIPDHIHYLGNLQVSGVGAQTGETQSPATVGVSANNVLSVSFASVTGTSQSNDVVIEFDGYIPEFDSSTAVIIDPVSGAPAPDIINGAAVNANYSGNPLSDSDDYEITPKSIATQKTVNVLNSGKVDAGRTTTVPGDFLEWRIIVEVSDYFSLDSFRLDDTFSDGHLYDAGSAELSVFTNGTTLASAPMNTGNVTLGTINSSTGDTLIEFDVGAELIARLGTDQLDGDLATDAVQTDKTQFVVTFLTEVQETFQHPTAYPDGSTANDVSVDIGDRLDNGVTAHAQVAVDGSAVSDGSGASVVVTSPTITKDIYAINGDTNDFDPLDPELAPGQTVTYRITIDLPTVDVEDLVITDYMPLPVYSVPATYTYGGFFSGVDTVPAAGEFGFGSQTQTADFPAGFFNSTNGTDLDIASVTTDSTANSIVWDFDSFDQPNSQGGTLELLFTTVIENVAFGDDLTLTNQAQVAFDNTNNPIDPINRIVQIETLSPDLNITKGVVATDANTAGTYSDTVGPTTFSNAGTLTAPFAGSITSTSLQTTPIDADISDVDAGDIIRFALTLENTGGFSATDIQINDNFPTGFEVPTSGPGLNLRAHLGDGTELDVNGMLFDVNGNADATGISFSAAGGGAETVLGKGRDDDTPTADGSNIIIVTYDLQVASTAVADSSLDNDVTLLSFAAFDGGIDFTAGGTNANWTDTASATLTVAGIEKTLVSTEIVTADNSNTQAVQGEYITYQIVLDIPEGEMPLTIIEDRLDSGLAFDSLISVVASNATDVTTDLAGGFANTGTPTQGDTGTVTFDLGNLSNANTDNSAAETLTLQYRVYVLASATAGASLNNRADLKWDRNSDGNNQNDGFERDSAANVEVISPLLEVEKQIVGSPPEDAGDPVTYQMTISHVDEAGTANDSDVDAYDASFTDTLPGALNNITLDSVVDQGGNNVTGFTLSGSTISNGNFDLAKGDEIIITVSATANNVTLGADITNTADITWTSLDDAAPASGEATEELTASDSDSVSFSIDTVNMQKSVVSTGISTTNNGMTDVVQGEYVTYNVVIDVPEGNTLGVTLIDTLPTELTPDPTFTPTVTTSSTDVTFSGASPAVVINGQEVRVDFNDITNVNRSNGAAETITVEYRVFVNSGTTTVDTVNTATLRWDLDNNGSSVDPTDGVTTSTGTVTFKQPELQVTNTLTTTPSDADDAATYVVVLSHTGVSNADALDATFSNSLPPEFTGIDSFTAVDGAGNPVTGFSISGNTLSNPDFDLALGESITLTINGTVNTSASAGDQITNTATLTWDSLGDTPEGNQAAEYEATATADASFTIDSPTITRTIVDTGISTPDNSDTDVVAGEYVTYQLVVEVPEGTTNLASIIDTLDPALTLDPSFAVNAVGSAGVTVANAGPLTPSVSGNDVQFDLGQIVNNNTDDGISDTVTLTYRVFVDNTVSSGDVLNASADLIWDINNNGSNTQGVDGTASEGAGVDVTVLSPELTLSKITSTVPADSADSVVYQMVIAHASGSETGAYASTFTDILPSEISGVTLDSVLDGGGSPVAGFSVSGNTVSGNFDLALGETITLQVSGTVNNSVVASTTVTNRADIDWDTIGTATQGNQAQEQTGAVFAESDFTVASPTFDKTILSTGINIADNDNTTAVAGEYVTYQLAVTVPEGQTELVSITDVLDGNVTYDTTFPVQYTTPSGVTLTNTPAAASVSGNTLSFDLGAISNTNTDNGTAGATAETVLITYRAFVANGVTSGTLTDSATLLWDSDNDGDNTGDATLAAGTSLNVTQAELLVEKELPLVPSDTGDSLTYTVLIRHTDAGDSPRPISGTSAYDVTLNDPVPVGINNVQIVSAVDENNNPVAGFNITGDDSSGYVVSHAGFNLDNGSTVLITLSGEASATITEGETVTNTASIGWSSLDDGNLTDGNDAVETSETDSDAVSFSLSDVSKTIVSTGITTADNTNLQAVAGEYVNYQIVVTVPQGTSSLAAIDDVIDAGLIYDSVQGVTVVASSTNVTTNLPQTDFSGVAGSLDTGTNTLSLELGDITNSSTGTAVETLTVNYRVFVADNATTAAPGTLLNNQATYRWDIDGNGSHDDPTDGQTDVAAPEVSVLAPELIVENTVSQAPGVQGDTVEYTLTIRHADITDTGTPVSTADAFDNNFSSTFPTGITGLNVVATDGNGNPVPGFTFTGNTLTNGDFDLPLGGSITLTVTGTADTGLAVSEEHVSSSTLNWTTLDAQDPSDGNDATEGSDNDTDTSSFSLASLDKTILQTGINDSVNDDTRVVTGEYVVYQLVVDLAQGTSALASIEDTLDAGLVFDSSYGVNITPSSSAVTTSLAGGDFSTAAAVVNTGTNSLTIALGDIENTSTASNPESLTVEYRVFVDDSVDAAPGNSLNNSASYRWDIDGNGSASDTNDGLMSSAANDVTVIAPELSVTNTLTTTPVDGGDTAVFSIVIAHTGASQTAALDSTFLNTLPSQYSNVTLVSSVDSTGNPVGGFSASGNTVENTHFDLPLGETITLTVEATVNDTAVANQIITDTATVTWDSLGDSAQGNQAVEAEGSTSDSASFTMSGPTFARTIVDTGITNATNTDGQVVAGEYITYALVVTVPEGTTPNANITDTLSPDLAFDPSYVISATGSSGVSFSGGDPLNPAVSGDTVAFDLGTIINSNTTDGTPDTVTILYQVFVEDNVADGDTLSAQSVFTWPDGSLNDSSSVSVLAPELHIDKAVTLVPSDVGDTIEYEIHIRHTQVSDGTAVSTADAYDVTFSDDIPAGIENVTVVSALDAVGNPVPGFSVTGNQVSHASFDLAITDSVTLILQGTMGTSLVEGDTIRNEALIDWTTLDLAVNDGNDSAEHTSSASDDATFSLGDISKSIVSTGITNSDNTDSAAVPGEYIDYQIVVDVPQGSLELAEILDTLDAGLIFDASAPVTVTPSSATVTTTVGTGDFSDIVPVHNTTDNTLSFDFGTINNTAPVGSTESLTIHYRTFVANDELIAASGSQLNNEVEFRWDIDSDGSNTGNLDGSTETVSPQIRVLTPQLDVTSTVTTVPAQHGDTITYTYVIAHNADSTATAYDVSFLDTLPAGLESLSIESAVSSDGTAVTGFTVANNVLNQDSMDIALGDTVTVTLTGIVGTTTPVSETVVTQPDIAWTSLDAGNPDDGSESANAANEYQSTANTTASFSIADIQMSLVSTGIDHDDNDTAEVVPGEYAVYSVVIDIPEGVSDHAQFVATLDPGLRFDKLLSIESNSASLNTSIDASASGNFSPVVAPAMGSEGELVFDLGTITNTAQTNGSAEQLTVVYQVYVDDIPSNAQSAPLLTQARFQWDIDGDGNSNGVLDGNTSDSAEPVVVLEPELTIVKNVSDADPHLGQRITYTADVESIATDSTADAFELLLADTLPDDVSLDLSSIRINGTPASQFPGAQDTSTGNSLLLSLDTLPKGDSLIITYDAVVTTDTDKANIPLDSPIDLTWTSLSEADLVDGNDAIERNATTGYQDTDTAGIVLKAPDYTIEITSDNPGDLNVGDDITYTLDVANAGTHLGTGIVIVQQWPTEALDPPSSISQGGTYDPATGQITWLIDSLDIAETQVLSVTGSVTAVQQADIDSDSTSANDRFTSSVSVTDDGLNGPDANLSNNQSADTDAVDAVPAYSVSIDNDIDMAAVTQTVPYTLTVTNEGDQNGTGVQLVHRFDPSIVVITDADGGVIDPVAGTVSWTIPLLQVGETQTFNVESSVIPTASLTTAEQLFIGSVSVTDDNNNGADQNPDNNQAEHRDMLLSGPGDPGPLLGALPDTVFSSTAESVSSADSENSSLLPFSLRDGSGITRAGGPDGLTILSNALYERDVDPTDKRIIANLQEDSRQNTTPTWEDDVVDGGDLLDTFVNPVQTCEPVAIDWSRWYPTEEDLSAFDTDENSSTQDNQTSVTTSDPQEAVTIEGSVDVERVGSFTGEEDLPPMILSFEDEVALAADKLHPKAEPAVVTLLRDSQD